MSRKPFPFPSAWGQSAFDGDHRLPVDDSQRGREAANCQGGAHPRVREHEQRLCAVIRVLAQRNAEEAGENSARRPSNDLRARRRASRSRSPAAGPAYRWSFIAHLFEGDRYPSDVAEIPCSDETLRSVVDALIAAIRTADPRRLVRLVWLATALWVQMTDYLAARLEHEPADKPGKHSFTIAGVTEACERLMDALEEREPDVARLGAKGELDLLRDVLRKRGKPLPWWLSADAD